MTGGAAERIAIQGPSGPLGGRWSEDPGLAGHRCGLLCHPHPLHGGTMDNKVVTTMAARCARPASRPCASISGGRAQRRHLDEGRGETEDAEAAASWCAARWPGRLPVIAVSRFGTYVALRLAQRRPASRLITIAPPVASFDFPGSSRRLSMAHRAGGRGRSGRSARVVAWAERLHPRPEVRVMAGPGISFTGACSICATP